MKKQIQVLKHSSLRDSPAASAFVFDYLSIINGPVFVPGTPAGFTISKSFRSDFFTIARVVSGKMKISIDMKEYEMLPGGVFISVPYSLKQISEAEPDCRISGISFTFRMFTDLLINEKIYDVIEFFNSKNFSPLMLDDHETQLYDKLISSITERAVKLASHVYGRELLANSIADFLFELGAISRVKLDITSLNYGRKEDLVMRFSRMAMQYHTQQRNLAFYSDRLFVTSKHLSETVKELTGKTASQIIHELDITEAKRFLIETDLSISEISYELNFSSPAFFSKFFTRLSGESPKDYRKHSFLRPARQEP